MNILINASNLKVGGGLQVASSICNLLYKYEQHRFVVVLSTALYYLNNEIKHYRNVICYHYDLPNNLVLLISGRDKFLDYLVDKEDIDAILSVFGPMMWNPRKPHLCGFARSQLVLSESPYYSQLSSLSWIKAKLRNCINKYIFQSTASYYFTENPLITERLNNILHNKTIFTVTNYYNQIFDDPANWTRNIILPSFSGISLLTISANYPHKNIQIIPQIIEVLQRTHKDLYFRFVLTIEEKELGDLSSDVKKHILFIGPVQISECPHLYQQTDIMFMPSLLECFSASYPEAMFMKKPIVTTDMDFARGLCQDAACYYSPLSADSAADVIYKVATDKNYSEKLKYNGTLQLKKFDTYNQRIDKLIKIIEEIV